MRRRGSGGKGRIQVTQAPPPSPPIRKLPVFQVVAEGYRSFFRYLRYLPQAAFLPTLLTLPLYWFNLSIVKRIMADPTAASALPLVVFLINIAILLIIVLFYVSWFRLTLLGPDAGRPPWLPLPRRRHLCFVWKGLLVFLIVLGIGILIFVSVVLLSTLAPSPPEPLAKTLSVVASLLPLIIVFFVTLRLGFVFPAVAVDEPYGLRNAWTHTKGQTLRLFAAFLLTALPLYLLMVAVTLAMSPELLGPIDSQTPEDPAVVIERLESNWLVSTLVGLPLGFCFIAIVVGAFSAAFKITTGWYPANPAAVAAGPPDFPKD